MYIINSKASEYIVRALVYLSKQNRDEYIMVRTISENTDIPQPYLSKIFQDLAKTDWIKSKKGKNGGVKLVGDTSKITLLELVSFNDGYRDKERCIFGHKECEANYACSLHGKCTHLRQEIHDFLSNTTINDFSKVLDTGLNNS
jgi:Rrf2 family protein